MILAYLSMGWCHRTLSRHSATASLVWALNASANPLKSLLPRNGNKVPSLNVKLSEESEAGLARLGYKRRYGSA